jgi:hypothetical protein
MELSSKGENNQSEIASILQVDKSIVCRDIAYLVIIKDLYEEWSMLICQYLTNYIVNVHIY